MAIPHHARLSRLTVASTLLLVLAASACSSSTEATAGPDAHDPAYAQIWVNGVDMTSNLMLVADSVTRVQVRFFLADSTEETTIESSHFSSLTFTPDTLATPAPVSGHHWQWDVTAQSVAGTGSVMVGFGHDNLADEKSFGPFPVTVVVAP
jgi:hypothetical protein